MEQNGLRQAHLVSIFGSRGRISEVVNGKRVISKAQAKAMGEFFKVSPELFIWAIEGLIHTYRDRSAGFHSFTPLLIQRSAAISFFTTALKNPSEQSTA
jgi:hypothetical protein